MSYTNRKLLLALGALLAFSFVGSQARAITNGFPDGSDHPYVGLAVFEIPTGGDPTVAWRCSGFLLTTTVFVTAGHCTDGAVSARIWFDENVEENSEYPFAGETSYEGTPYTYPGYGQDCGKGLPRNSCRDLGVIVLSEPADPGPGVFPELPPAGFVDTLANRTDVLLVGYGVQGRVYGGGPPSWGVADKVRLAAWSELIGANFGQNDYLMRTTMNPGGGTGGTCYGDSGGPNLLDDVALGLTSYGPNGTCTGVGYATRLDVPEFLDWINSFIGE